MDIDTYLSSVQKPFPEPTNYKIRTKEFLAAAKDVVGLLETLGKAFAPARYDMNGNIEKITKKYNEDQKKNEYVEDMLLIEKNKGEGTTVDALMWLRRGLHFILEFFENIVNDNTRKEDLAPYIKLAYSNVLQKYHGWFGTNLFNLLTRLVPNRKVLLQYIAFGQENCDEIVVRDMKTFTVNLRICVEHLIEFYKVNGLESDAKV